MNNLTISGMILGDIKYTPGDKPRANFTLAVRDPFGKTNDKGYKDDLLFSVTCFGQLADRVNDRGFKLAQAVVSGRVGMYTSDRGASLQVSAQDVDITSRPTGDKPKATAKAKAQTKQGLNDDGTEDPFSAYAD